MRATLSVIAVLLSVTVGGAQQSGELIERTLAIVGGQAITLLDVRAARGLGLIAADDAAPLIERALVLREVQRYAPTEPAEDAVNARVAELTARFQTRDALLATLASVGFSELQLRGWARDDLRIAAYLDQRFAASGSAERRAELVRDWIADIRRRTVVVELAKP